MFWDLGSRASRALKTGLLDMGIQGVLYMAVDPSGQGLSYLATLALVLAALVSSFRSPSSTQPGQKSQAGTTRASLDFGV